MKILSFENSKKWFLNLNDFTKGLIITILAAAYTLIYQYFNNDATFDFNQLLKVCGLAAMTYLSKNLLQNEDGKIINKKK